jgi:spermidine synthase
MTIHPFAGKILVVGGSPAVVREFLKYRVSQIDFVEIDPVLVEISKALLSTEDRKYLNDKRVKLLHIDARRYIKSIDRNMYDLVVLNIPEPSTANINRFYTREFFEETKSVLNENGILYLSLPVSYGYIGKRMQMANGSVYASLKEVLPYVEVSSEEYGIIIASGKPVETGPDILTVRFLDKKINTKYFQSYIFKDAFSPIKTGMVKGRLGAIKEINTDLHPVSYLYNLMLWAEIHGGKWLNIVLGLNKNEILVLIIVVLILITAVFLKKGGAVSYAMFTTGYITMAFSLIVILAYQSYSGYIYEKIGLLTGTFMLGGAAGAFIMRKNRKPVKWLRIFELMAIVLMASAMMLMKQEIVFYVCILFAGIVGGGQFAAANLSLREKGIIRTAGKLYAVDLGGSFLGSFLTAVLMVPLSGIQNTVLFLIFMKIVSLMLLLRYKNI